MLVIRKRHTDAFEDPVAYDLICRLVAHVERTFAGAYAEMGKSAVRRRVRRAVEKAAGYGIRDAFDLCRYVDLAFLLGEGFDTDDARPWTAETLNDASLSADEKLTRLTERARAEGLTAAGAAGDPPAEHQE